MTALTSPTLERLRKETRLFLNQPNAANSFWTDPEIDGYLNDGLRTFFLEINERAEGQFDKTAYLDVVSGQETVSLPSDFFQVKKLYAKQDTLFKVLEYNNDITQSYDSQVNSSSSSYEPYYYFVGNSVVLRPIPGFNSTGYLRLDYTALPDTLISGGDIMTSSISPVYKELVILHAVYKAKVKEDLVNGGQTSDKAAILLADAYSKFKETLGLRSKWPTKIIPFNP